MLSIYLGMVETELQKTLVEQIYYDFEQVMYRTAYSVLHNRQDAEDVVHDTFVRIISDIDRFAEIGRDKQRSYIIVVTKHIAIDRYREAKRRVDIENVPEAADESGDVERSVFGGFDTEVIDAALSELPEDYRAALILRYFYDASVDSIAAALGISYDAAKSRLMRARNKLYAILKESGGSDM